MRKRFFVGGVLQAVLAFAVVGSIQAADDVALQELLRALHENGTIDRVTY